MPIIPKSQRILDRYPVDDASGEALVFPIVHNYDLSTPDRVLSALCSRNARANLGLERIQEIASIETHLTFHLSRSSAAYMLYDALGDVYKVKKILGHSRVEFTEQYLRGFDDESLMDEYHDVF